MFANICVHPEGGTRTRIIIKSKIHSSIFVGMDENSPLPSYSRKESSLSCFQIENVALSAKACSLRADAREGQPTDPHTKLEIEDMKRHFTKQVKVALGITYCLWHTYTHSS
jgi:hypothetical protein